MKQKQVPEQDKASQTKPTKQQAVEQLLAQLPTMERRDLVKHWCNLFHPVPIPALRKEMLLSLLAYRIQEKAFGGLNESTARKLHEIAQENALGEEPVPMRSRSKTGTRYVREYNGRLHQVTVLDVGYEYEGKAYRSLTELAKVITGLKWSGPAFFGLKSNTRKTRVAA